jgi:hypothetical protein
MEPGALVLRPGLGFGVLLRVVAHPSVEWGEFLWDESYSVSLFPLNEVELCRS